MAKRRRRRRRIHLGRLFFVFLSVAGFFALLFLGVGQVRQLLETAPPIQDMFHDITSSAYPRDHSQEVAAIKKGNALDKVVTAGFTDEEVRSLFYTSDLSDSIVAKITGSTFFSGQDFISIEDLRYVRVLYIDFNGDTRIGELIVNEEIASDMEDIFYDLYLHQYQIGKMALADTYSGSETQNMEANNTFALLFSQPYAMEQNAFNSGYAIHLNPLYNPKVSESYGRTIVTPASSYSYANRLNEKSHMINKEDYAYEAFTKRGYKWAGTDKETQNYGVFWKTYPKKETEEDTDQEEQDTTPTYDPYGWYTQEEPEEEKKATEYDVYGQPIVDEDEQESEEEETEETPEANNAYGGYCDLYGCYDIYGNPYTSSSDSSQEAADEDPSSAPADPYGQGD